MTKQHLDENNKPIDGQNNTNSKGRKGVIPSVNRELASESTLYLHLPWTHYLDQNAASAVHYAKKGVLLRANTKLNQGSTQPKTQKLFPVVLPRPERGSAKKWKLEYKLHTIKGGKEGKNYKHRTLPKTPETRK